MEFANEEKEYIKKYEEKFHVLTNEEKEYIIKTKRENNADKTKKELNDFFNADEGKKKEQDDSCPDCLCEDCDNYCISKELGLIKWAKRIIKYTVTLGGVWKEMF